MLNESNKIVIDLQTTDLSKLILDERNIPLEINNSKQLLSVIIGIALMITFSIISVAQILRWTPLDNFIAFQDIQRNFNNWTKILSDYQTLESNKIKNLVPLMSNYNNIACIDYGTFYLPIFFSNITLDGQTYLLPTAVRRGNGDGWSVTKSDSNDPAALQQCLYVASELSDNTITCGIDMYNKIGYGGFLNKGHWCNTAKDLLYNYYKN